MARVRNIDRKLERIIAVINESASEIIGAAEDAQEAVLKISAETTAINDDLQHEKITADDAGASYQARIAPLHGKLENRMRRMLKNTKAIASLLNASKALYDSEEEAAK